MHFSGRGLAISTACFYVVKEPPKMVLRRILASVSGDGRSFRCCTVGEFLHNCDWVSVRAVQEKCDERKAHGDGSKLSSQFA